MSETGPNPALWHPWQSARQPVTTRWRPSLTGSPFYTVCTQRILQRSHVRRRLVPRSSVECRRESNDLKRFDRRGELLLRVVHLARAHALRAGVRAGRADRVARPSDHLGIDPQRHHPPHRPTARRPPAPRSRLVLLIRVIPIDRHLAAMAMRKKIQNCTIWDSAESRAVEGDGRMAPQLLRTRRACTRHTARGHAACRRRLPLCRRAAERWERGYPGW